MQTAPERYLQETSRRLPRLYRDIDAHRAEAWKHYGPWPSWCYMPTIAIHEFLRSDPVYSDIHEDSISQVAAFHAWRRSKTIYTIDHTLFEALWQTDLRGNIPVEVLLRLPSWGVYVSFEKPVSVATLIAADPADIGARADAASTGFFVYLDSAGNMQGVSALHDVPLLAILFDSPDGPTLPLGVPLFPDKTLTDAVRCTYKVAAADGRPIPKTRMARFVAMMSGAVSIVLYLCSVGADISQRSKPPPPRKRRGKKDKKPNAAALAPTFFDVGANVGATLRRAQAQPPPANLGGTHAAPRAHVRRAHWHLFWTGKRDAPKRKPLVKWLSPMLINASEPDELAPTVRGVEAPARDNATEPDELAPTVRGVEASALDKTPASG